MISTLFRRKRQDDTISAVYGAIVAHARSAAFFRSYGVPDTVEGRLEMIVLHAVLVLRRLAAAGERERALGQGIFDLFCQDMDNNLREMGVGDLGVPRHMRRIGEAFYGRSAAYEQALEAEDPQRLAGAIAKNIFSSDALTADAERLAVYVRKTVEMLAAADVAALDRVPLAFPEPDDVVIEAGRAH